MERLISIGMRSTLLCRVFIIVNYGTIINIIIIIFRSRTWTDHILQDKKNLHILGNIFSSLSPSMTCELFIIVVILLIDDVCYYSLPFYVPTVIRVILVVSSNNRFFFHRADTMMPLFFFVNILPLLSSYILVPHSEFVSADARRPTSCYCTLLGIHITNPDRYRIGRSSFICLFAYFDLIWFCCNPF